MKNKDTMNIIKLSVIVLETAALKKKASRLLDSADKSHVSHLPGRRLGRTPGSAVKTVSVS